MRNDAEIVAKYDYMMDRIGNADEVEMEDINLTAKKYWRDFLSTGCDATSVAQAMKPKDVYEHYDELIAAGAKIDVYQNMRELGSRFVRQHFTSFAARGIDTDKLIRFSFGRVGINDVDELRQDGVSIETIWSCISEGELLRYLDDTRWLLYELRFFLGKGISKATVAEWLQRHMNSSLISDMFEGCQFELWDQVGIDTSDYEEEYLEHYFQFDGTVESLTCVNVRIEKLLKHIPAKDLVEEVWDFDGFVREFAAKFDLSLLAKKILAEIGYSSEYKYFDAMHSLICYDPSPFSLQRFIECVDVTQLDADEKEIYYETLLQAGVDEAYLTKFL